MLNMNFVFLILSLFVVIICEADVSPGGYYEYAGIYEFESSSDIYSIVFDKTLAHSGEYPETKMLVALVPTDEHSLTALLKQETDTLFQNPPQVVTTDSGHMVPSTSVLYELTLDTDTFISIFTIDVASLTTEHVAFFTEHHPEEFFETETFPFYTISGSDIQPFSFEPDDDHSSSSSSSKEWNKVLLYSFLINLITLIGVLTLIPGVKCFNSMKAVNYLSAFASGTLSAAAFFLVLPEALEYISSEFDEETDSTWRWGSAILGGYAVGLLIDWGMDAISFFRNGEHLHHHEPEKQDMEMASVKGFNDAVNVDLKETTDSKLITKSGSIFERINTTSIVVLVGDFMHNFVDGITLGAAINSCSNSVAYSVAIGIIAHEISQELADFYLLVGRGGLHPWEALSLNFVSGTSLILGAIIVTASEPSNLMLGILLAFGGGAYLYIAFTECASVFSSKLFNSYEKLGFILSFTIGCIAIGLVLINHEHCDISSDSSTGGHAHAH